MSQIHACCVYWVENNKKRMIMNTRTIITMVLAATLPLAACSSSKNAEKNQKGIYIDGKSLDEITKQAYEAGKKAARAGERAAETLRNLDLSSLADIDYSNAKVIGGNSISTNDADASVVKTLDLVSFHSVIVNTGAVITYHQGRGNKVVMRATPELAQITEVKVSNGTMTVDYKKDKMHNRSINGSVFLEITCPSIDRIQCNGAMSFIADKMDVNSFTSTNNGSLSLKFGTLKCGSYSLSNNGSMNVSGNVEAANVNISNNGSMKVQDNYHATTGMTITNNGSNKMVCDINTPQFTLTTYGADKDQLNVKSDQMSFKISGSGKINGTFKGKLAKFNCSGAATIDMDVDCSTLNVDASGVARLTLRGTADETKIESSGISKVDTSALNKF